MRLSLLLFTFVALPVFAQFSEITPDQALSLVRNDREAESFYATNSNKRLVEEALKDVSGSEIISAFRKGVEIGIKDRVEYKLCSYDINSELTRQLKLVNPRFDNLKGAIHYLRSQNLIDDVVAGLLLKAEVTRSTRVSPRDLKELPSPTSRQILSQMIRKLDNYEAEVRSTRQCFDESFPDLFNKIKKLDSHFDSRNFESLLLVAKQRGTINEAMYVKLEQGRLNEIEKGGLRLKDYMSKRASLRRQYPLRDVNEKSSFVTQKVDKSKISRRQKLLENYTDVQIMLMGNVIKKLRARLEADKIEILVYSRDQVDETITLEPMERFRFALKLLRKELQALSLNTYFDGRSPDYFDVMVASYEIGLIPASEVDSLAGLQDVWNPEKTLWDKALTWGRMFSSVATIAIPAPYGFIPALVIVVIEATTAKDAKTDDVGVLF